MVDFSRFRGGRVVDFTSVSGPAVVDFSLTCSVFGTTSSLSREMGVTWDWFKVLLNMRIAVTHPASM